MAGWLMGLQSRRDLRQVVWDTLAWLHGQGWKESVGNFSTRQHHGQLGESQAHIPAIPLELLGSLSYP